MGKKNTLTRNEFNRYFAQGINLKTLALTGADRVEQDAKADGGRLKKHDINGDGKISLKELDVNGDGKLTGKELDAAFDFTDSFDKNGKSGSLALKGKAARLCLSYARSRAMTKKLKQSGRFLRQSLQQAMTGYKNDVAKISPKIKTLTQKLKSVGEALDKGRAKLDQEQMSNFEDTIVDVLRNFATLNLRGAFFSSLEGVLQGALIHLRGERDLGKLRLLLDKVSGALVNLENKVSDGLKQKWYKRLDQSLAPLVRGLKRDPEIARSCKKLETMPVAYKNLFLLSGQKNVVLNGDDKACHQDWFQLVKNLADSCGK